VLWPGSDKGLDAARVDPAYPNQDYAVSEINAVARLMFTDWITNQVDGDQDLLAKVLPDYPATGKRTLQDNGTWLRTLRRDDVDLVRTPIQRITPDGVVTADGAVHDVDVIVYATGFRHTDVLWPMTITGRDGVDLHRVWGRRPYAYLGITVPGFPNLFCLYGPNTNLVANGSIIFLSECEVTYVLGCIRLLLETHKRAVDCRHDVCEAYNAKIDEGNRGMVWGVSTVNSWYKNAQGRITQNWPFTLLEFWQLTQQPDPADYVLL